MIGRVAPNAMTVGDDWNFNALRKIYDFIRIPEHADFNETIHHASKASTLIVYSCTIYTYLDLVSRHPIRIVTSSITGVFPAWMLFV